MDAPKLYCYRSKFHRVEKDNSVHLFVDFGFKLFGHKCVQLARLNTPKIKGEGHTGLRAKSFLHDILSNSKEIVLQSESLNVDGCIGEIWADKINLSDLLKEVGLAEYRDY